MSHALPGDGTTPHGCNSRSRPATSVAAILRRLSGLCILAVASLLVGCTSPGDTEGRSATDAPASPDTMNVTDALGRSVVFSHPPRRVISLAPNLTEIVYATGAGSRLAAVTSSCNFPAAADTLAHVDALPVDFEAVAARNPELVLATEQINAPRDADTFAAIDVPVYFFSFPTVQSVFNAVRRTGELLGTTEAAADTARALEASLDRLRRRTARIDTTDRPRVLVLIGDETLYAFGGGSYVHTLVNAAGGRSVTAGLDAAAPTLSEEYVIQQQPDVIVGAFGADYDTDRLLALHPTWDVVPAIQHGRVYSLPPELLLRPGPRLVQGAEAMAEVLHPGLFAAPSP